MTLKRLARTGRAALRGGAGIVGVRCEGQSPFVVERLSMKTQLPGLPMPPDVA